MIPKPGQLLVETFPARQSPLSGLLSVRGAAGAPDPGHAADAAAGAGCACNPVGFVANEYALAIWAARDMGGTDMDALFDEDMLGDDLDSWLADSNLYKRTFRNCAIIAGLIQRRFPGKEKTGRQVTFSSDLIYDVLQGA